jgi:pimeloyl-ACP methyl ester carboxylesterase
MQNTTTTIRVLDREIHEIRGGEGRPLLYLHSAMGEAVWLPHLSALAQGRELHAPAHPGFLSSAGIEQIRDIEDMVEHYYSYLDVMGWESVDVVGLSLGGWIAAELAARFPHRVSKLVLASACGIWVREKPIADIFAIDTRFPDRLRNLFFHDPNCPAAQLMVMPGNVELPDEMLINIMNAFAATAKIGWNPLLHDPRLEGILHRVTAQTLCVWGANDRVVPLEYGEKYAKLIPGARLEVIPACGHLAPLENPLAWLAVVKGFLG